jgi:hypothetical protein
VSAYRILLVGLGNLGAQIFDLLVRLPGHHTFLVGGRNLDYLRQRSNLSLLAAIQLGYSPEVACTSLDLWNIEQTAEVISRFQPDLIVCSATLAQWERSVRIPSGLTERLASVPMGPRLPLHLTLVYKLMQAVRASGQVSTVVNAIYPDVVNPVLKKGGLAPTTGIGDLSNNVPALRKAIAMHLNVALEQVEVQLVMARYVSYWMSRRSVMNAPFHFVALVNGENVTHLLDTAAIFAQLPTTFKRIGGTTGLLMTAASAIVVIEGIVTNAARITHAPGPNGLPGGYPVSVDRQGVSVVLPDDLSMGAALEINEAGLRLDGIEKIDTEGTVYFTEESMAILKETLGYECRQMPLAEVEYRAQELRDRYRSVGQQVD